MSVPAAAQRTDIKDSMEIDSIGGVSVEPTREEIQRKRVAVLQQLIKEVNTRNGTTNCGYVALRVDELLRDGPKEGLPPVPVHDANLNQDFHFVDNTMTRSTTTDPRLLERILKNRTIEHEAREVIHADSDQSVIEIDCESSKQTIPKARLYKTNSKDIGEQLRCLPRRKKDGSAHGFIIFTHSDDRIPTDKKLKGHIINFLVDNHNQVYFIDGQPKDLKRRVLSSIPEGYHPDIFYINSIPPEGFIVKQEVTVKQELKEWGDVPASASASEGGGGAASRIFQKRQWKPEFSEKPDFFLGKLLNAFLKQNRNDIDKALKHISIDFVINSQKINRLESVPYVLARAGVNKTIIDLLLEKGAHFNSLMSGAACGGHQVLLEYLTEQFNKTKNNSDTPIALISDIAFAAALGGQSAGLNFLIQKIEDLKGEPDFQGLAEMAAQGGDQALAKNLLERMRKKGQSPNLNRMTEAAVLGGLEDFAKEFIKEMETKKEQIEFQEIANTAAFKGKTGLVEYLIGKMQLQGQRLNLSKIAEFAARGGHEGLTNSLIEKMKSMCEVPCFLQLAFEAASGNHAILMRTILFKMQRDGVKPDLNYIAYAAILGSHIDLLKNIFVDMVSRGEQPELNLMVQCAIDSNNPITMVNYQLICMKNGNFQPDFYGLIQKACKPGKEHVVEWLIKEMLRLVPNPNFDKIKGLLAFSKPLQDGLEAERIQWVKKKADAAPPRSNDALDLNTRLKAVEAQMALLMEKNAQLATENKTLSEKVTALSKSVEMHVKPPLKRKSPSNKTPANNTDSVAGGGGADSAKPKIRSKRPKLMTPRASSDMDVDSGAGGGGSHHSSKNGFNASTSNGVAAMQLTPAKP